MHVHRLHLKGDCKLVIRPILFVAGLVLFGPKLYNPVFSEASWDSYCQDALTLVPGGLDLVPDPSRTHHGKRKTEIGYCCLRKSVISPTRPEVPSDRSESQYISPTVFENLGSFFHPEYDPDLHKIYSFI